MYTKAKLWAAVYKELSTSYQARQISERTIEQRILH
jgi:uncharacterized membrane protein